MFSCDTGYQQETGCPLSHGREDYPRLARRVQTSLEPLSPQGPEAPQGEDDQRVGQKAPGLARESLTQHILRSPIISGENDQQQSCFLSL